MDSKVRAIEGIQQLVGTLNPWLFVTALIASVVAAYAASFLYRVFYERRGTGSQVNRSFPLLALAITTLFINVQMSLPLSLGLLGALSIIRFRTPIKEPEEVGFIMLVIASSIVCATFNFHFLLILYVLAFFTLLLVRGGKIMVNSADGMAIVMLKDVVAVEQMKAVERCINQNAGRNMLESPSSKDGVVSMQFSFSGLKTGAVELQAELNAIDGVNSVNIFFNRPGSVV